MRQNLLEAVWFDYSIAIGCFKATSRSIGQNDHLVRQEQELELNAQLDESMCATLRLMEVIDDKDGVNDDNRL